MVFSETNIKYINQELSSNYISIKDFLIEMYSFNQYKFDDINYDIIFEQFINELTNKMLTNPNEDISAKLGDITLVLRHKRGINTAGKRHSNYYINDIRINKDEIHDLLERATCFEQIKNYNDLIKKVSECSLKIHNYLDKGIDIKLNNPIDFTDINITIVLRRKNKRQYLEIGKSLFLIKNTQKILDLKKVKDLNEFINIILNPKIIQGTISKDLKKLIIDGKQKYIDAIAKSKKLLESVINKFNLETKTIIINNESLTGFIVRGQLNNYFIVNNTDNNQTNN